MLHLRLQVEHNQQHNQAGWPRKSKRVGVRRRKPEKGSEDRDVRTPILHCLLSILYPRGQNGARWGRVGGIGTMKGERAWEMMRNGCGRRAEGARRGGEAVAGGRRVALAEGGAAVGEALEPVLADGRGCLHEVLHATCRAMEPAAEVLHAHNPHFTVHREPLQDRGQVLRGQLNGTGPISD